MDIKWSCETYSPVQLLQTSVPFPLLVKVCRGNHGYNQVDAIYTNQVLRIQSIIRQERVLLQDRKKRLMTFPLNWPLKFKVKKNVIQRSKRMLLKDIVLDYYLPVQAYFDKIPSWKFKMGQKEFSNLKFGQVDILEQIPEYFFIGNLILDDNTLDEAIVLLPLYSDVDLSVAEGLGSGSQDDWQMQLDRYSQAAARVDFRDCTGVVDLLYTNQKGVKKSKHILELIRSKPSLEMNTLMAGTKTRSESKSTIKGGSVCTEDFQQVLRDFNQVVVDMGNDNDSLQLDSQRDEDAMSNIPVCDSVRITKAASVEHLAVAAPPLEPHQATQQNQEDGSQQLAFYYKAGDDDNDDNKKHDKEEHHSGLHSKAESKEHVCHSDSDRHLAFHFKADPVRDENENSVVLEPQQQQPGFTPATEFVVSTGSATYPGPAVNGASPAVSTDGNRSDYVSRIFIQTYDDVGVPKERSWTAGDPHLANPHPGDSHSANPHPRDPHPRANAPTPDEPDHRFSYEPNQVYVSHINGRHSRREHNSSFEDESPLSGASTLSSAEGYMFRKKAEPLQEVYVSYKASEREFHNRPQLYTGRPPAAEFHHDRSSLPYQYHDVNRNTSNKKRRQESYLSQSASLPQRPSNRQSHGHHHRQSRGSSHLNVSITEKDLHEMFSGEVSPDSYSEGENTWIFINGEWKHVASGHSRERYSRQTEPSYRQKLHPARYIQNHHQHHEHPDLSSRGYQQTSTGPRHMQEDCIISTENF